MNRSIIVMTTFQRLVPLIAPRSNDLIAERSATILLLLPIQKPVHHRDHQQRKDG